jgi:hypothetical protein
MIASKRWLQFSLRAPLLTATVAAVGCGVLLFLVRFQKLEARAKYHESMTATQFVLQDEGGNFGATIVRDRLTRQWHQDMALACRKAKWRPWARFREAPRPSRVAVQ